MRAMLIGVLVVAACGRLGFDPPGDGTGPDASDVPRRDAPPAVSCGGLPPTCGPMGTSPCCESPVVTGGMFFRGYDVAADARYTDASHPATVSSFRLDKYEVTVGRFRRFVATGTATQASPPVAEAGARKLNGLANQGGWDTAWNANLASGVAALSTALHCGPTYASWTDAPAGNEDRPVTCVTWYEAMAFCLWDGGYLASEAEAMYASSGGSLQRAYPWSNPPGDLTIDDARASYFVDATKQCYGDGMDGCSLTDLVRVGSKPAGDGAWGQSELGGNAWEWSLDWQTTPLPDPCDDCANLTASTLRVLRGGAANDAATFLRAADRGVDAPMTRNERYGIRCARSL